MVAIYIPYTGSIGAEVLELSPGTVKIKLPDRRSVRNHLNSIHALALMNLGEMTTGMALYSTLPKGLRIILVHLEIDYHKKARGTLTTHLELSSEEREFVVGETKKVPFKISNEKGDVVSSGLAHWKIGQDQQHQQKRA